MSRILRVSLAGLLAAVMWVGCGSSKPELDGACQSDCDCKRTDAPLRCPGEWLCNADRLCEYTCEDPCGGQVSTCPADTECNGTVCSARTANCL